MRELRARVWIRKEQRLYPVVGWKNYSKKKESFVIRKTDGLHLVKRWNGKNRVEVSFFTGFLDKKKKPIFDKDLIAIDGWDKKAVVFWHRSRGQWMFRKNDFKKKDDYLPLIGIRGVAPYATIVGNAYQNIVCRFPELLD